MAATDIGTGLPVEHGLRNASSDRKRAHDEIAQDPNQVNPCNSPLQKRPRRSKGSLSLSSRDSGVPETQNDFEVITPNSPGNHEQDAISSSSHPMSKVGSAPSMNWNVGTKAKIRTSLGGGLRKASEQEKEKQEKTKSQSKLQSRGSSPFHGFSKFPIYIRILNFVFSRDQENHTKTRWASSKAISSRACQPQIPENPESYLQGRG